MHFVWATSKRFPVLTPDVEKAIYRCIQEEALRLVCDVLAINGMPDHVHLFVKMPTSISPAKLMQQAKGVSGHFAHDVLHLTQTPFWQEGYGVFSVGRNQKQGVIDYIRQQKQHHASGSVHPAWEEADEEYTSKHPIQTAD